MKNFVYTLACLILVLLFQNCKKEEPDNGTGCIYGTITDKATGEPIKSAGVELSPGGLKTVTGSEGQFEFVELTAGNYMLFVTKIGYADQTSGTIAVKSGLTAKGDVQLEKLPPSLRVVNDDKEDIDLLDFGAAKADITRSFNIFNDGEFSLEWEITYTADWIKGVSKQSGVLKAGATQALVVTIDRALLNGGENTTTFHITSDNGSKQLTVRAVGDKLPIVSMVAVNNIAKTTADFFGEIQSVGDPVYTERGFVFSQQSMPTLENTIARLTAIANGESVYKVSASGLIIGQTYYVRAYAVNAVGASYSSNEIKFTMVEQSVELLTEAVTDVDVNAGSAVFHAVMSNAGIPQFTERGFFYGVNPEPDETDNVIQENSSKVGNYSVAVTGLPKAAVCFVRAYAKQNDQYVYGNTVTFSMLGEMAVVSTSAVTAVGSTQATLHADVSAAGNPAYTERGFCYATHSNPSIADNRKMVSGTGLGSYSLTISNLAYQTQYYVRAYVMQDGMPVYGNVVSFVTTWQEAAVSTLQPTKITGNSATMSGRITYVGDPQYHMQGFCYSTDGNPTVNSSKVERLNGIAGVYNMDLTNLSSGTTYYVRAFVRQGENVVYGNVVSFTTVEEPVVYTNNVTDLRGVDTGLGIYFEYSVQFNGGVSSVGTPAYTKRGFVYGTTMDPVVGSGTSVSVTGTGTGTFSATTTVDSNKTYYVRAYVRTTNGYVYGNTVSFRTY